MSGADKLELKVKKLHNDATIPKYAKDGDAGLDLFCINDFYLLILSSNAKA